MRKYALASVLALFLIGVCFLLSESFGRTVVFDAPGGVVDIEEGTVRPIVITVSAPKGGSAKIGGVNASCACIEQPGFPINLEALGAAALDFKINTSKGRLNTISEVRIVFFGVCYGKAFRKVVVIKYRVVPSDGKVS